MGAPRRRGGAAVALDGGHAVRAAKNFRLKPLALGDLPLNHRAEGALPSARLRRLKADAAQPLGKRFVAAGEGRLIPGALDPAGRRRGHCA